MTNTGTEELGLGRPCALLGTSSGSGNPMHLLCTVPGVCGVCVGVLGNLSRVPVGKSSRL